MVFFLDLSRSSLFVGVALLSILGIFQILFYLDHFLFHLFHHVQSDCDFIHWITPTDWNLSLSTIEFFKRAHLQRLLIIVVVGKFDQWQEVFPPLRVMHYMHP
jgi:hypothetical protein